MTPPVVRVDTRYSEARLGSLHPPHPGERPVRAEGTDPFVTGWYAALDAVRQDMRREGDA